MKKVDFLFLSRWWVGVAFIHRHYSCTKSCLIMIILLISAISLSLGVSGLGCTPYIIYSWSVGSMTELASFFPSLHLEYVVDGRRRRCQTPNEEDESGGQIRTYVHAAMLFLTRFKESLQSLFQYQRRSKRQSDFLYILLSEKLIKRGSRLLSFLARDYAADVNGHRRASLTKLAP